MIDKWILIPFLALILFSIIAVYSASSYSAMQEYGDPNFYLVRQIPYVLVSLFIAAFVYIFPFRVLKNKKFVLFGTLAMFALLIIVLFMPPIQGARRWIPLPGFNIQPAEFAKIFVIWYLAYIFSRNQQGLETQFWKTAFRPGVLVAFVTALVFFQPDTGTAIILGMMILVMVSASGASLSYGMKFFLSLGIAVAVVLFVIYNFGEHLPFLDYRYDRFLGWWDPFGYYETEGHQLVNSYYALNRGGFFGVGIGNSVQKTGYLPFPYTDFIIAIVGEELGLLGVGLVLLALTTIIGRAFYIGSHSKDSFNSLICIGVGAMLLVQSLVNLAGVTGLLPITGVTFPLLSYGGSSLMSVSISIALVANASSLERLKK
jgi:cell division protein FtsW